MLKKKVFLLLIVLLLSIFTFWNFAFGSWISLTTEELIEQADLILIGNIDGVIGERQIKTDQIQGFWLTDWRVNVQYYLKGKIMDEELVIATPGAQNKNIWTSIDYRLDAKGKQVLLFLKKEIMMNSMSLYLLKELFPWN